MIDAAKRLAEIHAVSTASLADDRAQLEREVAADQASEAARLLAIIDGAKDVRAALGSLGMEALRVFAEGLASANQKLRFQSARELAMLIGRIGPADSEKPPELTPEEREAQLRAAMQTPEVRAFLEREGWSKAE